MALTDVYVQVYGQLPDFFGRIAEGQAPERFTRQHLKDLGFTSSNFNAAISLLKALGFLTTEGTPTDRYHRYRDKSQSRIVMGEALREAYGDLFVINAHPTDADRTLVEGKFKSSHNVSERLAKLMANTFYSLLTLADLTAPAVAPVPSPEKTAVPSDKPQSVPTAPAISPAPVAPTLHYNIQIHLPATKDIEVLNAIFRSIKEHLLG